MELSIVTCDPILVLLLMRGGGGHKHHASGLTGAKDVHSWVEQAPSVSSTGQRRGERRERLKQGTWLKQQNEFLATAAFERGVQLLLQGAVHDVADVPAGVGGPCAEPRGVSGSTGHKG